MKLSEYITGVSQALKGKPVNLTKEDLGWVNVAGGTYQEWKANDYENAYGSITKITNRFMTVRPFAVGEDGEPTSQEEPAMKALYLPNDLNSAVEFREALCLMYLVHDKTHILVHHKGNKVTPKSIYGYSFMEGVTTITVAGKTTYTINTDDGMRTFTDAEVITLRGLNPYKINSGGMSATRAAQKWINIDDFIAKYQQGFFKNGAVPSGRFNIIASTVQDFKEMVKKLQSSHRGAGANNNIDYVHVPIDNATGKPVQAQVEWIPYAVPNKDLGLQELFDQANKKIDSAYGVPASIRGVGENNNFATARTDQQNFIENVVDPITLKIWDGFTSQLNRIMLKTTGGGLGFSIGYDLEVPALEDEELVKEEKGKIRDERVQAWLDKGYSMTSIKDYLESGDIEDLGKPTVVVPNSTATATMKELHCKDCDRFLGETAQAEYTDKIKCSNSKCKSLKVPVVKEKSDG